MTIPKQELPDNRSEVAREPQQTQQQADSIDLHLWKREWNQDMSARGVDAQKASTLIVKRAIETDRNHRSEVSLARKIREENPDVRVNVPRSYA